MNYKILIFFILLGCAANTTTTVNSYYLSQTEVEEKAREAINLDLKLKNVSYKIQKTFVDYCPTKKIDLGIMTISTIDIKNEISFTLGNIQSLGSLLTKNINAYKKIVNLEDNLSVAGVIKNSPADKAGLKVGDAIIEINNKKIQERADIQDSNFFGNDLIVKVKRNNQFLTFNIKNDKVCNVEFEAYKTETPAMNYFRSKNVIFISEDLVNYVKNEDELILILTNEFSHYLNESRNLINQTNQINASLQITQMLAPYGGNSIAGTSTLTTDIIKKLGIRYSDEDEGLADYTSINLTSMLGYNPEKAKLFWERLVKDKPPTNMITEFRSVDSKKIRIINYSIDEKLNRLPTKQDYENFLRKYKI
jgi:hypothetical protein